MARGDGLGCSARVEKGRERLGCLLEAIGMWIVGEINGRKCIAHLNHQNVWMTINF